ncbi:hypothetical protein [Microbacterium aurum]
MTTPAGQVAPIDGDPQGIRRRAAGFTRTAQAIEDAMALLDAVAREAATQESKAVDALADAVGDTRSRLSRLKDRYEVAGSQLTGFADVLETAQARAADAVAERDAAQASQRHVERRRAEAEEAMRSTVDPIERTDAAQAATGFSQHLRSLSEDLVAAGNSHAAAVESVRERGDAAADAIAHAIDADGVNDSLLDKLSGAFKDWVKANAGWMSMLKNILGGITAIVGLVSIFFPIFAPLALVLGLATTLLSFSLAYAGEGSWLEFGLDMIGVLTFGVGAVAAKGVGLAMKGTQAMRGLTYNRQATSLFQRVIHPIATRRSAIAAVGDEFQSLLPAGQQLMTRMPQTTLRQKFTHEWLELSGRQVEQFRTIMPRAELGADSLRGAAVEMLGRAGVQTHRAAAGVGTALDMTGVATTFLDNWETLGNGSYVPGVNELADGWQSVKQATTSEVTASWPRPGP